MSRHNGGGGIFQGGDVANTHVFHVRQGKEYAVCGTSPCVRESQGNRGHSHIPVLLQKDAHEGRARRPLTEGLSVPGAGGGTS